MGTPPTPALLFHTVRHLKAGQVCGRIRSRLYRSAAPFRRPVSWEKLTPPPAALKPITDWDFLQEIDQWRLSYWGGGWNPETPGTFDLLNDCHDLGTPPNWRGPSANARDPALWLFHLHYWDWALDTIDGEQLKVLAGLVESWLDACPRGVQGGFAGPESPYTMARRLPNWVILLRRFHQHGLDVKTTTRMERAILSQGDWLARHLEWEHRGNHLLENLYTLAFLAFFREDKGMPSVWRLLAGQLKEQVSSDGAHGEGAAMYHCLVLDRLLDLVSLDIHSDKSPMPVKFRKLLHKMTRRMADFLAHILPANGHLPRLGDTADGMTPPATAILNRTSSLLGWERQESAVAVRSGHWVCRDDAAGHFLLFDAADGGLPYLGAHQHADLLQFHLTLGGRLVITSGGAGLYREGKERSQSRSSREHATVKVDNMQCAEPWKSFRLGRRGSAHLQNTDLRDPTHATASHDGFKPRNAIMERSIQVDRGTFEVSITDVFRTLRAEYGHHPSWRVCALVPLAPGIRAEIEGDACWLFDEEEGEVISRVFFSGGRKGRLDLIPGTYYHKFGLSSVRWILRWRCRMVPGNQLLTRIAPVKGGNDRP